MFVDILLCRVWESSDYTRTTLSLFLYLVSSVITILPHFFVSFLYSYPPLPRSTPYRHSPFVGSFLSFYLWFYDLGKGSRRQLNEHTPICYPRVKGGATLPRYLDHWSSHVTNYYCTCQFTHKGRKLKVELSMTVIDSFFV